jgi:hypothetical protein
MEYSLKTMLKLIKRMLYIFLFMYVTRPILLKTDHDQCETDNIDISNRQQIAPLGQDDEDAFIFVHVSK